MKNDTFNQLKRLLTESLSDEIPEEAGVAEDVKWYKGPDVKYWIYFGNCKNTVDVDNMWDASQMANFLTECELYDVKKAIPLLQTGDRPLPKRLTNWLERNKSKVDDLGEVVCGVHEDERIGFIYIADQDIHYFFDIFWK